MKSSKIIEITGLPGRAKSLLAQMLANRHGGVFIDFPNFSPVSYTGLALAQCLKDKSIFREPEWWAHLSAANLVENTPLSQGKTLVIYANYKTSYHALFKGGYNLEYARNIIKYLPEPNKIYLLEGLPINYQGNNLPLPKVINNNIEKYYNYNFNSSRYTRIDTEDHLFYSNSLSMKLNKILNHMSQDLIEVGFPVVVNNKIPNINTLSRTIL